MPGMVRSLASASALVRVSRRSRLSATLAAWKIVWARTPSTPARCQSQDGMRRQVRAAGRPACPRRRPRRRRAEPGEQDPPGPVRLKAHDLLLQDRRDQRLHEAAGAADAQARMPLGGLGEDAGGRAGRSAPASSWQPSAAGRASSSQAAPGPQACATRGVLRPSRLRRLSRPVTRIVAGPSGVSDVRHTAPASSIRNVGSLRPRPCTESVRRTSTWNGACHSRASPAS